jgi:hypothetical protein
VIVACVVVQVRTAGSTVKALTMGEALRIGMKVERETMSMPSDT